MGLNGLSPRTIAHSIDARVTKIGINRVLRVGRRLNFYYFWEKRWFFIALAIGYGMLQIPLPGDLSREGMIETKTRPAHRMAHCTHYWNQNSLYLFRYLCCFRSTSIIHW